MTSPRPAAYLTPAGGMVVTAVTPCGIGQRDIGVLGFTTSLERSGGIRAWARNQGVTVSERGRIPASVAGQYQAATQGS